MSARPERGIVISTAELASEGVEPVLDTIAAAGASAVTTSTSIVVEATSDTGQREPPIDVAGHARMLDRPIWGKRVAHVHHYAAHSPDRGLWRELPWDPPKVAPDEHRTDLARQAIDAARQRGMRVYIQLAPWQLPGVPGGEDEQLDPWSPKAEFRPKRLVGGSHPEGIAYTGCLNHPDVRALGRVRLRERLRHYGDVDGIVLDRAEFPTYFLEKVFTCFCEHCQREATSLGYDWAEIVAAARTLWDSLHTIRPDLLEAFVRSGGDWGELVPEAERMQRGMNNWLRYKADSVKAAVSELRAVMAEEGTCQLHLSTTGFPPPWGRMSGASTPPASVPLDSHRVRLYSHNWLMMVNWWSTTILRWNQGASVTAEGVTRAVLALFDIELEQAPDPLAPGQFGMPLPDEGHNLTAGSYRHRLENAQLRWESQAPMIPIVHAYRSAKDFASVLDAVEPFARDGVWIHRYGYLSDEKLEILRQAWSGS